MYVRTHISHAYYNVQNNKYLFLIQYQHFLIQNLIQSIPVIEITINKILSKITMRNGAISG